MVRSIGQARAVAQVVGAMKASPSSDTSYDPTITPAPLRVVNGMPSTISTTTTTTTISPATVRTGSPLASPSPESANASPTIPHPYASAGVSNAPSAWPTASATLPPGLAPHPEEGSDSNSDENNRSLDPWARRRAQALQPFLPTKSRKIIPSLPTLEKAVSARIYFENLYFPLLRQQPSREQRRLAMEKEMDQLGMSDARKNTLRERWRQNETDYLRERRAKVDVNAFVKLKTIGHGEY
jgi:protein-serine/threonine kinase